MSDHREHHYAVHLEWTGNLGQGTSAYRTYSRDHEISSAGKENILASSDPKFRGDAKRYNPEDLLVASLSSCHMLWYLHLCAEANVIVVGYEDAASGTMTENKDGSGRFKEVVLRPQVKIKSGDIAIATELHERVHHMCFIANSVNFPVRCEPRIQLVDE
jgi:organic hydroperoxide reductase OsmC/OhrA